MVDYGSECVNILGGNVGNIKKNKIFISCCEEIGLAANGDRTK